MSASKFLRPSPLAWMVLLLSFGLLACQPTTPSTTWEENAGLLLELRSMKGEPVSDAQVILPSGERLRTDVRGQLLLKSLPRGRQVLQVEAEGFASTAVAVDVNEGVRAGTRLDLLPLGPPAKVFNTSEGAVFDKGGISVTVPPGDLVDAEGRPIRGEVEAYLAPLNLEDLEKAELLAAPGVLQGELRPGTPPVNLESVGLMVLIFRQKAGQGVSAQSSDASALARGSRGVTAFARRLGVRGKAPGSVLASSYRPPGRGPVAFKTGALSGSTVTQQVPVWRLDTTSGRWIPTGDLGTLRETSPGSRQLEWSFELTNPIPIINVALPFWWRSTSASKANPLQPPEPAWLETACLAVQVEDEEGRPVAGRTVVAQGVNYVSVSRAVTDARGQARLEVMRGKEVQLDAGAEAKRLPTGGKAGTCTGEGAEPTPVTLRVPAPACRPGAERDCGYSGPKGTRNVGVCRASRQSCDVNGSGWSDTCEGEVLPQQERCDNSLDDDCDGTTNESCASVCEQGETRPCYGGPAGTEGVGLCQGGTQKCLAGGSAWSACEGRVLPRAEDCSSPQDENCDGVACQCWPGETQPCAYTGPAGTEGVGACHSGTRTCDASGTAWSACTGEVLPQAEEDCTTPVDDDCDGVANETTVCICTPNTTRSCYTGPTGTQDVGTCSAGTQTCAASGTAWSTCTGDVKPQPESCANALDEDCNGLVNDALECVCLPGTTESCYTGPTGTSGVGLCQTGIRTCEASGTAWGTCQGEVLPQAEEDCTTPDDDDCDGVANEGTVCICAPNSSQSCYSGPAGTQGVGLCQAGSKTCEASGTAWGACTGEVLPQTEDCTTFGDDNCDGVVNEGTVCVCAPNASRSCYGGPMGTEGVGVCMAGSQQCNTSGTAWGACTGEVTPQSESCTSPQDEDCDGQRNESPCGWVQTTSMGSARFKPAGVVLNNGHVLVMGGADASGGALDTAQVYDPIALTWTTTNGAMTSKRSNPGAVLLNDGKVLVMGGWNSVRLNTSELYDPTAKTWTAVGQMSSVRELHTTTLLSNGKVLVAGGLNASGQVNTAEVYDPVAKTWSATANLMTAARALHAATLLNDGRVLVTGGHLSNNSRLAQAEVYNPATNTWSAVASMNQARTGHTSTLLSNGRVLVVGGSGTGSHVAIAEEYDPVANTWTNVGALTTVRDEHSAVLLNNGHVLVTGGDTGSTATATAETYDPDPLARTWTTVAALTTTRTNHLQVLLDTGEVLVVGGGSTPDASSALATAELYNPTPAPQAGNWMLGRPMGTRRHKHTATVLANGKVLVAGGNNGTDILHTAELDDPATNRWSPTNNTLAVPRENHTATVLANGKVLVVGGSAGTTTNTAELYDPTTNTWSATGALTWARDSHTATLSATGKVLVTGGRANGTTTSTAELYDPGTGQWSSVSSLSEARIWHTATLLPGGKVFVAGGNGDGSALRLGSAAVYESSLANTWSSANGTMTEARDWHTATLLTTGKVLVAGGYGAGGFLQGAELYDPGSGDPSQGTWSTTGALTTARREHAATLLTDGTVLVTGGLGTGNLYLQSAELYDPGAGTWSSVNALFAPLKRHTSTVLNDGRVLVTGGHNSTGVLNTVQLYSP